MAIHGYVRAPGAPKGETGHPTTTSEGVRMSFSRRELVTTSVVGALGSLASGRFGAEVEAVSTGGSAADVRAFGAIGDGKHDDGPAFLAAAAALEQSSPNGGALLVPAPSKAYFSREPVQFTQPGLRIVGEGSRMNMSVIIGRWSGTQEFNSSISGLLWKFDSLTEGRHALTIRNVRQLEITGCSFDRADRAINLEPPPGATFHSIAGIKIHHNQFFACNYHLFGSDINSWRDAAISDCSFSDNSCQIARRKNVFLRQIDGIQIINNVTFMIGYASTDPSRDLKEQSIHIGSSNGVQIHNNNLFEPGYEGILVDEARGVNITGNWIARAGQRDLRSAIKVTGVETATINVTGNQLDLYTRHGVELDGTAAAPPNLSGNVARFDAETKTYWGESVGNKSLSSIHHAAVFVDAEYSGPLPVVGSQVSTSEGEGLRLDPLGPAVRSYARLSQWSALEVRDVSALRFEPGAMLTIGTLKDADNSDGHFGGIVIVTARLGAKAASRADTYVLFVSGGAGKATVNVMGQPDGPANGDGVGFDWSISRRRLHVRTTGDREIEVAFEILALGNVIVV